MLLLIPRKHQPASAAAKGSIFVFTVIIQRSSIASLRRVSDNAKQKRNEISLYRRLLAKRTVPVESESEQNVPLKYNGEQDGASGAAPSTARLPLSVYASLLRNCNNSNALQDGYCVHHHIIRDGFHRNDYLGNLLVQMYGQCSAIMEARASFDRILFRDVFSFNFMMTAYVRHGHRHYALNLFDQMQCEGTVPNHYVYASLVSACASSVIVDYGGRIHARISDSGIGADISVCNALINMYDKRGSITNARKVFDRMTERDTLSWTAIIAAYSMRGYGKEALKLFDMMLQKDIKPNEVTFVSILPACGKQGSLTIGKRIHGFIADSGFELNSAVGNALLDMYGKCGSLESAQNMFSKMAGRRDIVSWTTMIAAYAQHGQPKEALKLFEKMLKQNVVPDEVTFVSVLSACSHGGFLQEGCSWWISMCEKYGIKPIVDHYNCMLDLFGRVGKLQEAEKLLKNMPVEPSFVSWMTLLSACKHLADVERGEWAAERVFKLDPQDPAPYVLLSNIYTAAGRHDDARRILETMKEKGLRKAAGISSIEVNGNVHEFEVDDLSHPQRDEIYATLRKLYLEMENVGYSFEGNVSESCLEEKDHQHSNHSEMLAIAFGILSTPHRTSLLITKNLKACTDCHSAAKLISKLTSRKIVLRDALRFHHIEDGVCSCADHW